MNEKQIQRLIGLLADYDAVPNEYSTDRFNFQIGSIKCYGIAHEGRIRIGWLTPQSALGNYYYTQCLPPEITLSLTKKDQQVRRDIETRFINLVLKGEGEVSDGINQVNLQVSTSLENASKIEALGLGIPRTNSRSTSQAIHCSTIEGVYQVSVSDDYLEVQTLRVKFEDGVKVLQLLKQLQVERKARGGE